MTFSSWARTAAVLWGSICTLWPSRGAQFRASYPRCSCTQMFLSESAEKTVSLTPHHLRNRSRRDKSISLTHSWRIDWLESYHDPLYHFVSSWFAQLMRLVSSTDLNWFPELCPNPTRALILPGTNGIIFPIWANPQPPRWQLHPEEIIGQMSLLLPYSGWTFESCIWICPW